MSPYVRTLKLYTYEGEGFTQSESQARSIRT